MSRTTNSPGGPEVGYDAGLDRRRLVEDNVALAHHLVRRFARSQGPNQDLVQTAMVGLVEAANRFDPSYGVPFAAFATKTIVGELKRHRRDTGWNVHVARRTKELALRLPGAVRALLHDDAAYDAMANAVNPYGDGRAAQRTVDALGHYFGDGPPVEEFTGGGAG